MPQTRKTPIPANSRRTFCCGAATLLLGRKALFGDRTFAQAAASPDATPTRPDVAAVDHDRILAQAARYLTQSPTPITSLSCDRSPGTAHDFYSEVPPEEDSGAAKAGPPPPLFTAHRDALFTLGLAISALTAAHLITGDARYAQHAALHLRAWFVDPATSMSPSMEYGQVVYEPRERAPALPNNSISEGSSVPPVTGRFEGILETLPLVEVAQAIPFLAASSALTQAELTGLHAWFAAYLRWLTAPQDNGPRLAALARDQKDHHGTSWLLQTSAYACLAVPAGDVERAEDNTLAQLRHRFKTVTLRAQISPDGNFLHELRSTTPYRDSLFNLDMMAAVCQLLSTRMESVWEYQLEDGPGMRAAIAYHFPFIADRSRWPFRADADHFNELPSRRASLLFSARVYARPEYATLWKKLSPDPPTADVLRTIPIHQPLLWVRQPPRSI